MATTTVGSEIPAAAVPAPTSEERRIGALMGGTGLALFLVMMLLGITMRSTQAKLVGVSDPWFYRLMTLHGAGMLVAMLLVMMGGMWFVLRPHVQLSVRRLLWAYGLIVVGAVLVLQEEAVQQVRQELVPLRQRSGLSHRVHGLEQRGGVLAEPAQRFSGFAFDF